MFERYTEKARRVIFFARYEASQFGSPYIETEHLLLGLLREDKALTNRFLRSYAAVESVRKQIEGHSTIREKTAASVDLPLTDECKRVLDFAAKEAEKLSHKHIGTEHLLLGLLNVEKSFAAEILTERGLKLETVREELARHNEPKTVAPRTPLLNQFSRDLTEAAMNSELDPVIGRTQEIGQLIETLGSRHNNNPLLIGERGVGKTTTVHGLVTRIADEEVPDFLSDKRILALDLASVAAGTKYRGQFEERLKAIIQELMTGQNAIIFVEDLPAVAGADENSAVAANVLRPALLKGDIQCISTCTPDDYQSLLRISPWIARGFRKINVLSLDKESTLKVLYGLKDRYEEFHGVSYTDAAIECAVNLAGGLGKENLLLVKATEMLDTAGTRVKLRRSVLPEDVSECQKRIRFIVHRMEGAVANHEFEKARFYSDEERKEREKFRELRDKYKLDDDAAMGVVDRINIEEVAASWAAAPTDKATQDRIHRESADAMQTIVGSAIGPQELPKLKVFLCHSSKDKPSVRSLYTRLKDNGMDPWLDAEDILPGQDWEYEISNAVRSADVVIVCMSATSINKIGYLQKEIQKVLDIADQQPRGGIFVIPLRLEDCRVPDRFERWQWVDLFEKDGFAKLMQALRAKARGLKSA